MWQKFENRNSELIVLLHLPLTMSWYTPFLGSMLPQYMALSVSFVSFLSL